MVFDGMRCILIIVFICFISASYADEAESRVIYRLHDLNSCINDPNSDNTFCQLKIRTDDENSFLSIPTSYYLFEKKLSESIFETINAYHDAVLTSFLIGDNMVMTNRHGLQDITEEELDEPICGQFAIRIHGETISCRKPLYCSNALDFCVIQMNDFEDGSSLGSKIQPLSFHFYPLEKNETLPLNCIGNAQGFGIQGARGLGYAPNEDPRKFKTGCPIRHGSSGSPAIDDDGLVVGVFSIYKDGEIPISIDNGSTYVTKKVESKNKGITSNAILLDLILNAPEIAEQLKIVY